MARILQVGSMYPPHHLGGYELVWRSATLALRAAGHDARVLTTDYRRPEAEREPEDADVHRELRWYWHDHGWPRLSLRERLALERHNASVFERHIADLRPHVVAWWAMGGMSLSLIERARRAGLPAVGMVHDDWMLYAPHEDQWLRAAGRAPRLAERTGIPAQVDLDRAARWLFVSEATRHRAREIGGWRLPDSAVAHSGIDASYLAQARPPEPWAWRMLCVGRIDGRKGIDTAIEALTHLPAEATLDVAGTGDEGELAVLRERAARQGVAERVRFLGDRTREQLVAIYAGADVVAFPVRWEEPWGLVPLEAMALGRPVVATGRGGSSEYLRDGENCLLFAHDDPQGLAAAVRRLAGDGALRERLLAGGRATAERHTDRIFNDRVLGALTEAAS